MLTHENLIQADYKPYTQNGRNFLQKDIRSEDQELILYFIRIELMDFRLIRIPQDVIDANRFHAEARFYTNEVWDSQFMTVVERNVSRMTVEQMEDIFARTYTALGCIPDPLNN